MSKEFKTLCLYIPRQTFNEADAIVATQWEITAASVFEHILDELSASLFGEIFSLELFLENQALHFMFTAESPAIDIIAAAIYTQLPDAEMIEFRDVTFVDEDKYEIATTELSLERSPVYRLLNFRELRYDTLSPVIDALTRFSAGESAIMQVVCRAPKDNVFLHSRLQVERIKEGIIRTLNPKYWFKRSMLKSIEEEIEGKCNLPFFYVNTRIAYFREINDSNTVPFKSVAEDRISAIFGGCRALTKLDYNGFKKTRTKYGASYLDKFQRRHLSSPMLLTTLELCGHWHPPALFTAPSAVQVLFKKGPYPQDLPSDPEDPNNCLFGEANYRGKSVPFGLSRMDRRGHCYVLGKSGSGKSCMLQLLVKNDMDNGHGVAVIDPHGDLVDDLLKLVPSHRVKDVIVLDPSDFEYPPSFNPLARVPDELKMRVTIGIVEIFQRLLGSTWSDRLEHVLRYTTLSLLSTRGTTILSIRRMLVDERYRMMVASNIDDNVLRNFWFKEYPEWASKYHDEAVTPLLDKIGEFVTTNMIRNMVGQPINRFDFREIMDKRKILLIKVSKGMLGDENSALLGAMIVAKIYQAAMSRADIPLEQRQDFYFYVDEFHNFATDSFNEILSESRKYRLNLTVANQFLGQIPDSIRKTILGNVSNLVTFRVGGDDANALAQEFQPRFSPEDIIHLGFRDFYIKMTINGEANETFCGRTLDVDYPSVNFAQECIDNSRREYTLPVDQVSEILKSWENEKLELMHGAGGLPRSSINLRRHLKKEGRLLHLSYTDVTDDDLRQLKEDAYNSVVNIELSDTNVSNSGLASLRHVPKLKSLRLDETFVTDEGLAHLRSLTRLARLRLDKTEVTDQGLEHLVGLPIKRLSLQGTLITDRSLSHITEFSTLEAINLKGTQISDGAIVELSKRRPKLRISS